MGGCATAASAFELDDAPCDRKTGTPRDRGDRGIEFGIGDLGDRTAFAADEKTGGMRSVGAGAGDEGVLGIEPMHEPLGDEEIERAVNGGRCDAAALAREALEDRISAYGRMLVEHDLEHSAP